MEKENGDLDKRTSKVIKWFHNPYNLTIAIVIAFAIIIRFYYFLTLRFQPLWWDEAVYASMAQNHVYGLWNDTPNILGETHIRPPLLPFLWGILIRLGASEVGVRFILEFLPSVIAVIFVYLITKEIYGKTTGIVATSIISVLWIHLFYTGRMLTNIPGMALLFPSIYFLVISLKKEFRPKSFFVSIFLLSLSTLIRYPNGAFFFAFLGFILLTNKLTILKNPKFWIAGIIGLLPIFIFFTYNHITYGSIFPAIFQGDYISVSQKSSFDYSGFNLLPIYLKSAFFITFLIGSAVILFELFLGYDFVRKNDKLKGHLLNALLFIFLFSFFIFYLRTTVEDRWLLPLSFTMVSISAYGITTISKNIKRFNKLASVIFLILIVLIGGYQQLTFASPLIENKKTSYLQQRQAFLWIKDNIPEGSTIIGNSIGPYTTYYSKKFYVDLPDRDLPESKEEIYGLVNGLEGEYLVVQAFMDIPPYTNEYLNEHQDIWQPINAYFFDSEQTQPALIIYKKIIMEPSD